ncbi:hypothetical protein GKZ89_08265 [Bacillus mangrovi]|uniref:Uncharacterized protein n=1 Tax=Metabacillus mangrovi TaxID=1491830 RepID=A0A7X2S492_9BACI|nr:hypothetical protein [Metabacillus mangrovi]MTH53409.1 hypothetical protein [Metabacillus mangrovi]
MTSLNEISREICRFIGLRKEAAAGTFHMPSDEDFSRWAQEFGLEQEMLEAVFLALENEEQYQEKVEPEGFRKLLPVMKTAEAGGSFYTITYIRQFENASTVFLHADWEEEDHQHLKGIDHFSMQIDERFSCRFEGGGGGDGTYTHRFIVSPALPDDLRGISLLFTETEDPFFGKPSGKKMVFDLSI